MGCALGTFPYLVVWIPIRHEAIFAYGPRLYKMSKHVSLHLRNKTLQIIHKSLHVYPLDVAVPGRRLQRGSAAPIFSALLVSTLPQRHYEFSCHNGTLAAVRPEGEADCGRYAVSGYGFLSATVGQTPTSPELRPVNHWARARHRDHFVFVAGRQTADIHSNSV